jgi:hypothetical protein
LRFKLGLISASRPWVADDSAVKGEEVLQHVELPELAWQLVYLRSGVTDAVTLLAKAMTVTKETRDL